MKQILKIIKQLYTAQYNIINGEIEGCDKNTIIYFHELTHLEQFKNKIIINIYNLTSIFNILSMGYIISALILYLKNNISSLNYFIIGGYLLIPQFLIVIYLEIDAWIVGIIKKINYNKK